LDDIAVEITPHTWRSWQGSVLHALMEELSVPYADAWLVDE